MDNGEWTVTFVAPFGLGQKTTVWARILPLARYLAAQGHNVTILIPPWDTPEDSGRTWIEDGVAIVHVHLAGGLPLILWRMARYLHETQPEIVHIIKPRAHAGLIQWYLWWRRKLLPWHSGWQPRILLDIDDWEQAWSAINGYPALVAHFLAWQEEWGIRHADGITAASQWLVQKAEGYAPQTPILYLPNGVTVDSGQWVVDSGQRIVDSVMLLYFTRFVEVEADWLVEFWRAVRDIYSDARLMVVGSALQAGREQVFQRKMDVELGSDGGVVWMGFVPGDQLPAIYEQAQCAIFPSDETPLLQAKCSVKLATTLLHGVPVVASAVGEQAAYGAEGAACLVDAGATPIQFAQAVIALLQDPQRQQAICENARRHLSTRYDWSRLGAILAEFYSRNDDLAE